MTIDRLTNDGYLDASPHFNSAHLNQARNQCQEELEEAKEEQGEDFDLYEFIRSKNGLVE